MKKRIERVVIAIALLLAVAALGLIGFFAILTNSFTGCFGTPFPSVQAVASNAYIEFPSSARNIVYDANTSNRKAGCTIWVKFEIAPGELNNFLSSIHISENPPTVIIEADAFAFFLHKKGWEVSDQALVRHGEPFGTDMEYQWIIVEPGDPSSQTVFVIVNKEWL